MKKLLNKIFIVIINKNFGRLQCRPWDGGDVPYYRQLNNYFLKYLSIYLFTLAINHELSVPNNVPFGHQIALIGLPF